MYKYAKQKGSDAIVTVKRSVDVAPEGNLRNRVHTNNKACKRGDPPWLRNPGQTSQEDQNRGTCGPTKRANGVFQRIQ